MSTLAVAALLSTPVLPTTAPAQGTEVTPGVRFAADADLAGRLAERFPAPGLGRTVELSRARVEIGIGSDTTSARLALTPVRSGGATGYIGVAGEALVPTVQIAEARIASPALGLAGGAGVIDDLWTGTGQRLWALPAVVDTAGLSTGTLNRSDLGLWAGWTARERWVSVSTSLSSGEGHLRRERNDGKDTAVLVTARPLRDGERDLLAVSLYARDGSRGLSSAANHRLAARVWTEHRWVGGGAEVIRGTGEGSDPTLLPLVVSGWARTGDALPAVGWVRVDHDVASRSMADSAFTTLHLGGGPRLPLQAGGPAQVLVGWQRGMVGEAAAALAGTGARSGWDLVFLQVGVRGQGEIGLQARP
ncbi:MAG: hypothetical protein ACI8PZ_003431 [Myxococcota bacterium]|jgi:hypothetical protein